MALRFLARTCPGALLVLAAVIPARAEVNTAQGVRLSFVRAENASDCISAPVLEQEIARRMGRDPFVGPARQWIEGIVTRNRGYYEVQLFERDARGKTLGVRRLREVADDCRKLDDAVELAIALIIDPTAKLAKVRDVRSDEVPALVAPVPQRDSTDGARLAATSRLDASTRNGASAPTISGANAPATNAANASAANTPNAVAAKPTTTSSSTPNAVAANAPNANALNANAPNANAPNANATMPCTPRLDAPPAPAVAPCKPCTACPRCAPRSERIATVERRSSDIDATSATPAMVRDGTNQQPGIVRAPALFVAANALVVSGVLPNVAPGVDLSTRIGLGRTHRFGLRLGSFYLPEQSHTAEVGKFSYGLTAFEAGACVNEWTRRVGFFGCASVGLGSIHAVVHDPEPVQPGDRWWVAARLEAGSALRIAGPVWLEARLFDLVAANRWRFRVQTDNQPTQVFLQRPFMPGAALGLGLHFD